MMLRRSKVKACLACGNLVAESELPPYKAHKTDCPLVKVLRALERCKP